MVPNLRSELSAERERDFLMAADRQRLIAAAAQRPSNDSPGRRPAWRLISSAVVALAKSPDIPFEVSQR